MKRYIAVLAVALFVAAALAGPAGAQTLKADKNMYNPGERITVHFTAPAGFAKNAWVGIVPSNVPHGQEAVNDQHDLAYQYLEGRTSGDLTFTAPMKTDFYDFRMHDTDNNGKEVASTPFAVMAGAAAGAGSAAPSGGGPSLSLDKNIFAPGESITVNFTAAADFAATAWVGLIPANVPHGNETVNDQHDLAYEYLEKKTAGALTFDAPTQPGAYDFRMHDTDNNGKEVATVSFTVSGGAGGPSLTLDKNMFAPGESITVSFTAAADFAATAWVGLIPANVPHGNETVNDQHDLAYEYLENRAGGALTFDAPTEPGAYDFRMHNTDNNGKEVASVSFTVSGGAGGPSLSLGKNIFAPGESITVNFTAAADFADNAWVGIIPANVPHGQESVNDQHDLTYQYLKKRSGGALTFTAPTKPGAYDFRMHDTDNNGKEVASVSFTVK